MHQAVIGTECASVLSIVHAYGARHYSPASAGTLRQQWFTTSKLQYKHKFAVVKCVS